MRTAYEFSKMQGRRNPYARLLKKPVTMRLRVKRKSGAVLNSPPRCFASQNKPRGLTPPR